MASGSVPPNLIMWCMRRIKGVVRCAGCAIRGGRDLWRKHRAFPPRRHLATCPVSSILPSTPYAHTLRGLSVSRAGQIAVFVQTAVRIIRHTTKAVPTICMGALRRPDPFPRNTTGTKSKAASRSVFYFFSSFYRFVCPLSELQGVQKRRKECHLVIAAKIVAGKGHRAAKTEGTEKTVNTYFLKGGLRIRRQSSSTYSSGYALPVLGTSCLALESYLYTEVSPFLRDSVMRENGT